MVRVAVAPSGRRAEVSLGETERQLSWAKRWIERGWKDSVAQHGSGSGDVGSGNILATETDDFDPTVDQDWRVDTWAPCDTYVVFISAAWFLPKCMLATPLVCSLLLPPLGIVALYSAIGVPPGSATVERGLGFRVAQVLALLLAVPAGLVITASVWMDYCVMAIAGFLWAFATCRLQRVANGFRVADPFRGGPHLVLKTGDIFVAMVGQIHRQGFVEAWLKFSLMFVAQPWLKYWISANPWVSDLGIRFVTQISTRMDDMDRGAVKRACVRWLSHTKLDEQERKEKDFMFFSPHYATPPPGRHMAIGVQLGGWTTLLVHSTHLYQVDNPMVLSSSVIDPMYRVMLWWNNPFHLYCGFVEACISSGLPSQPEKPNSGEHPMWLVCGHNYLSADRNSPAFGPGYIDLFFDKFLPNFVHYIRSRIRGKEVADEMWQDVISKDGVSRPDPQMGGNPQLQAERLKAEGF